MDGKNIKRVARYLLLWLLFMGILLAFCCHRMQEDYKETAEKMLWLRENHPELESELIMLYLSDWQNKKEAVWDSDEGIRQEDLTELEEKYGFSLYSVRDSKRILSLAVIFAGLSAGIFFVLLMAERLWTKRQRDDEREAVLRAVELVERYQNGVFIHEEIVPSTPESELFQEKLQQLGKTFQEFKERFALEEKNTKGLITNISHQLKTPLASLRMSQELLESGELSEAEREEFLLNNRKEIEKLENLLEEMLKLSRLENHMIQLKPQCASLRDTLVGAVNTVYMKAFARKTEISLEMADDIEIKHDARWTQEVFVNILDNGVKYSPEGSRICIRVEKMTGIVLIEIEDNGIGIAPEEYHKIFKRFYRGEKAVDMEIEGAGVGLYLARTILERQGGSIRVKSGGNGSIFQVTLPLRQTAGSK